MVITIGLWIRIPFGTRSRIPLMGSYGFRGIGFRIDLRGLSSFRVTPGLIFPELITKIPMLINTEIDLQYHFILGEYTVFTRLK